MNLLEITIEVTDLSVATIKGDRLNGRNGVRQQRGGSCHPYLQHVSPKRLSDLSAEQSEDAGFSESQQVANLPRTHLKCASAFVYQAQYNSNAGVHS
jgi:hypothetical protein